MPLKVYAGDNRSGKSAIYTTRKNSLGSMDNDINEIEVTKDGEFWILYPAKNMSGGDVNKAWGPYMKKHGLISWKLGMFRKNDVSSVMVFGKPAQFTNDQYIQSLVDIHAQKGINLITAEAVSSGQESNQTPEETSVFDRVSDKVTDIADDIGVSDAATAAGDAAKDVVDGAQNVVKEVREEALETADILFPGSSWLLDPKKRMMLVIGGLAVVGITGFFIWRWYTKKGGHQIVQGYIDRATLIPTQNLGVVKEVAPAVAPVAGMAAGGPAGAAAGSLIGGALG